MAINKDNSVDFNNMEVECEELNIGPSGTVTQITNRSTGVTLNRTSGQITTDTTSLAAEGTADFIVTNTKVSAKSVVVLSVATDGDGGATIASVTAVAAGSFTIRLHNANAAAGTAETGAMVLNFVVINGV